MYWINDRRPFLTVRNILIKKEIWNYEFRRNNRHKIKIVFIKITKSSWFLAFLDGL